MNSLRFIRSYRAHICDDKVFSMGRSILVRNTTINGAYRNLKNVLQDSKLRQVSKYQETFERPTDRRLRKKKEGIYNRFLDYKRRQVRKAYQLEEENRIANKEYEQI